METCSCSLVWVKGLTREDIVSLLTLRGKKAVRTSTMPERQMDFRASEVVVAILSILRE